MKTIFFLCIVIFAIVHIDAWVAHDIYTWQPGDDRTKCFLKEYKKYIPINADYQPPNECFLVKCTDNGDTCNFFYTGCPPPGVIEKIGTTCRVVEDKSLIYPKCCPHTVCD